jgi:hypothetical protein
MLPTPPVIPGTPMLGHIVPFLRNRQEFLRHSFERFGAVFTIRLGPRPVVVMIGPEYHQFFFMETDKKLSIDKPYDNLLIFALKKKLIASQVLCGEQRTRANRLFHQRPGSNS